MKSSIILTLLNLAQTAVTLPPQGGKFFYANYYPDVIPGFHYVRATIDNQNLKFVLTTEEFQMGVIGSTCPVI